MTTQEYEKIVEKTCHHTSLEELVFGLCGEVGEVAQEHKWMVYTRAFRQIVQSELGDVLWYLTAIAKSYGFTLEQLMKNNVNKVRAKGKIPANSYKKKFGGKIPKWDEGIGEDPA